jgi:hypothetical protein
MSPSINDREFNLWFKTAQNWYDYGVASGLSGLTPPNWNDDIFNLQKKIAYYTARIAAS